MAWLSPVTVTAATSEPVDADEVRAALRLDTADFDSQIDNWIAGARAQIERITGTRLQRETVKLQTNGFADLDLLPIGPVAAISAIQYLDPAGAVQVLDPASYELFGGDLQWGIRPALNARWPNVRAVADAVRITVLVGYDGPDNLPDDVRIALLHIIRGLMDGEKADVTDWLVNHRLWL